MEYCIAMFSEQQYHIVFSSFRSFIFTVDRAYIYSSAKIVNFSRTSNPTQVWVLWIKLIIRSWRAGNEPYVNVNIKQIRNIMYRRSGVLFFKINWTKYMNKMNQFQNKSESNLPINRVSFEFDPSTVPIGFLILVAFGGTLYLWDHGFKFSNEMTASIIIDVLGGMGNGGE